VAKKKSKSLNTAHNHKDKKNVQNPVPKKEETMVSKVEVKKPQDTDKVSRIVGSIFIVLGILLVGFGVYSFIKYNSTPKLDTSLVSPSLNSIPSVTNANKVTVTGNASGYDTVYVYLNNQKVGDTKVKSDNSFSYDVSLDSEGTYKIAVAGVKGFPTRHLSSQSLEENIEVDRTAPVLGSIKYPSEVGTKTFTVTGTAEKGSQIIVKRGTDYYSVTSDDQGNFKIADISLDEGPNIFNMVIKDTAGNETPLDSEIKVTYSAESSVDGNGTSTSIPVAAGNLENMKDILLNNSLTIIFGVLALVGAVTTTSVLYLKNKKD
jgi:hypothetical protein